MKRVRPESSDGDKGDVEGDRIADLVLKHYDKLHGRGKPHGKEWTVLAAILLKDGDEYQLVALGTGNRVCPQAQRHVDVLFDGVPCPVLASSSSSACGGRGS